MMDESKKGKNSRRRFLSLGLLAGAGLIVNKVDAHIDTTPAETTNGKKIKMLTADGQLVEVDEQVLAQAQQRTKAGNQDILNWSEAHSKTKE
jgi:hypothetical protein